MLTYADIRHVFVLSEQLTRERETGGGAYALTYADVEAVFPPFVKKQFSASHRNLEHYTPRDGLERMCLHE
jgi:hypothetical protein